MTAGATEAIAASLLALCEPGDEVVTFEPYYDSYAACTAMAGAERKVVTLQPPDYHFDPGGAAGRDHAPDPARCSSTRRTTRPGKVFTRDELAAIAASVRRARPHRGDRRGLRAPRVRRRARAARDVPRHARPHGHDLVGGQDVLVHRLEDRLGVRVTARCSTAVRTAKQFLTYVNGAPFQYAIATGLRAARRSLRGARVRPPGPPGPAVRGSRRRGLHGLPSRGHVLRHDRHPRAGRGGRHGVLPQPARSGAAWSRCRTSSSTTTRPRAARSCGSRSASAPRCSTRRSSGWRRSP